MADALLYKHPSADVGELAPQARFDRRKIIRWSLLLLGPALLIAAGLYLYLGGGRYVATDNAYVRADKVTISTDVSGIVAEVAVRNDQAVAAGQLLFRLDDEPYRIALAGAEAKLDTVRAELGALKATYRQKLADIQRAETDVAFYAREYDRQRDLNERRVAAQSKLDEAQRNVAVSRQGLAGLRQEAAAALANLNGAPDAPVESYARFKEAIADVDRAERDLRRTAVHAPIAGIVTNVENLQPGEYLPAAQSAFSLVASGQVWIEASPKETDLTYVKPGDRATVTIDTYPGRAWEAAVASISPATGAEFALLPPQNASGNWVKVVQRIPVRLSLEMPPDAPPLRAGMSASVEIDTGHSRSFAGLLQGLGRWLGL